MRRNQYALEKAAEEQQVQAMLNSFLIIWLCLARTGNNPIDDFDLLKWILTAV